MGRKPLATAVKEASGALKKDPQRRNPCEPTPQLGIPAMPDHLTGDAASKWEHLAGILVDMSMESLADADLMAEYCQAWADSMALRRIIAEEGYIVNGKRNSAWTDYHKATDRLIKLMPELGLTPSSRSRLVANPKKDNDPFEEWMKAKMESRN